MNYRAVRVITFGVPLLMSFAMAASALTGPEATCELKVKERYDNYDVNATTASQLRRQMRQRGTRWGDGETYAAETTWDIKYDYDLAYDHGRCSVKTVKTSVEIVYHLPHRVSSTSDNTVLTSGWNDYMAHLKRHEYGHKDIAVKTAAEVNEILASLGSFSSEADLEREAVRRTEEKFHRMKEEQIHYDEETRHGETQGAVLHIP